MTVSVIAVVGVLVIVAVQRFSERLGVAAPLGLVVVGIALGFIPAAGDVSVGPEVILAGVLPLVLYASAVNMPAQDFRRNLKAITGLAVLLVVVTTVGIGALLHLLVPQIGWAAAFALGAIVSPTDAVAATSLGRKLGLPSRLVSMIEGEGLVNDASALVLLRSATAAIAGSVSLWSVAGDFVLSVAVAVIIGVLVGVLNVRVRARLNDPVSSTAVTFVVPFVAYVPTEELHASGVLAVVIAGLVTGDISVHHISARERTVARTNWRTASFVLESGIFLLMGLSMHRLVEDVSNSPQGVGESVAWGLTLTVVAIVIRLIFVVPLTAMLRMDLRRASTHDSRSQQWWDRLTQMDGESPREERRRARVTERLRRMDADAAFVLNQPFGWRSGLVLGWAGMRGAITVAAAQTLPEDLPYRPEIILIAYVVALATLLVNGLSLPWVIRLARVPGDDAERIADEGRRLWQQLNETATSEIDDMITAGDVDPDEAGRLKRYIEGRDKWREELSAETHSDTFTRLVELQMQVLAAERDALFEIRHTGVYSSEVVADAQQELDADEIRFDR
ncbi:cation:proton antiporter [Williamsia sterculiae]|uniref:Sodium/proton antiporter, CPA1 family n=1 Tax=Williamsia sterculiae TaxID=1344003 RepID=A0A1N7CYG3_9NOCA|nr:sodium:proton antiporter [Williamsia sterculiae]SIR68505.1 sodium/proton antiporter, CPA1 family [Williamsia sterculiae]